MQRERKREQQRERFYAREQKKRAKRDKEFADAAYHRDADAAAASGEQVAAAYPTDPIEWNRRFHALLAAYKSGG